MDNRAEVREFLTSRRAKVTPADVGLPDLGGRRVAGLRRAEVASLAGISVEYLTKLERGALAGASASVLESLARALRLDDAERAHLFDLASAADGTSALARPRRRSTSRWAPRPGLQWALDAYAAGPAMVRNGRMDMLATNALGAAMHSSLSASVEARGGGRWPNFARFTFLDEDSHRFFGDWDLSASTCVSILRTEAGRDPRDKAMHDLVSELSTRSAEFRRLWSAHDVRLHGAGTKRFHHEQVGDLELAYESLEMVAEPGLTLTLFSAEPASPTAQALQLLASWAATERSEARSSAT